MSDENGPQSKESGEARQRWVQELQGALDRTGAAARTAWEATRENRTGALESAKQAVKELGEVLEKGMEAARERWDTESAHHDTEGEPHSGGEEKPPPPRPAPPPTDPSPTGDISPPDESERP